LTKRAKNSTILSFNLMHAPSRTIRSTAVFPDHDMPIAVMRLANHGQTALHAHDFHELVLITSGAGRHITARGAYPLKAGDAFLIRGSTRHGYAETSRLELVNILFNPRQARLPLAELDLGAVPGYHALFSIEPHLRQAGRSGPRLGLNTAQLEQAAAIIGELEAELQARRPGARFMASSHLMRLIGFLSRCYSALQEPRATPVLGISRALSHIEAHYAEPLTVAQLARVAGMSPSTFMRRFRDAVGRSPVDTLIHTRIARACERLRHDSDLKLAAIADTCGFADANYFSRLFRRVMGCTPRAYRALTAAPALPPG
jgi:AraC-like DNA-binding protein/quercetin dioxygenase-like cupin family protein